MRNIGIHAQLAAEAAEAAAAQGRFWEMYDVLLDHGDALQPSDGSGPILVDLADVTYADSTVIAGLVRLRNDADAAGRRIALLIGDARLARLLQYAGLAEAFNVFDDRGAALTYLMEASA